MIRRLITPCCCWLILVALLAGSSQTTAQAVNPLQLDPRAARAGGAIFRAQCATCHGADAKGISTIDAPDLTLMWVAGDTTDEGAFNTIQNGIPGSIMPPHGFPDAEIWMLVSYLRSVAITGTSNQIVGNINRGSQLFSSNCSFCHRVDGNGGSLGPNLSSITGRRSEDALIGSIRNPSANMNRRYRPVSFLTSENENVRGTLKSEDAFSVQIMDSNQQLRGFMKSELRQFNREEESLMPVFSDTALSNADINDILSFLQSDRGR